jgi:hypothetical protein
MVLDLSRIEQYFLKENYFVGLNFPNQGVVFAKITSVETIPYIYNEIGDIDANEYKESSRVAIAEFNINNLFSVDNCEQLYQVFYGIRPSPIRAYLYYPWEQPVRDLIVKTMYSKAPFGFVDGYTSPFYSPSPATEIWIPVAVEIGFAWYNPTEKKLRTLIHFIIRRHEIELERDPELVEKMLKAQVPVRLVSLSGVKAFDFDIKARFDVEPVKFGFTREEIERALAR